MPLLKSLSFSGVRRVPMLFQTEAAECGLACLAMVASAYGLDIDLAQARARLSVSLKGMNLAQLMAAARALDLAGRPLKLDMGDLKELRLPCVLHWDMNHFVVLSAVSSRHAWILDPAQGRRKLPLEQVAKHFTGVALELFPTHEFTPREIRQRVGLRQLMGRVAGLKLQMLQILGVSLTLQLCALLSPLYLQWVVDQALVSGDQDLVRLLSLGFLLLVCVQAGINALRSWAILRMGTEVGVQWAMRVFAHLLRLPQSFFEKRHLGDIVSRFGSMQTIQHTLTTSFLEGIIDGVLALVTLTLMVLYSGLLSGIVLLSVLAYALLRMGVYAGLRQAKEEFIVLSARQQSNFLESARGIQAIKLFGRETQRQIVWHNHLVDSTNRDIRTQRMTLGYELAHGLLSGVANVAVVWTGANLILDNAFSIGMLFAFVSYKTVFSDRMISLVDKGIEFRMLDLQAQRLADIVLTPREDAAGVPAMPAAAGFAQGFVVGTIRLEGLGFRYSELDPYVLRNVNMELPVGKSIAIVGPSGCGKTTLAKLLLGLLQPSEGRIVQGETDLRRIALPAWRSQVAAVMQDDQLFAGSIADNICFFDDAPSQEKIVTVAQRACIHADIEKMNMGYNTLIGDMGTALSGGQKQRILLARALYHQPQVLILDEATSHLDIALEQAINQTVRDLAMTRIVIAHRPQTIASCDLVLQLFPCTPHSDAAVAA